MGQNILHCIVWKNTKESEHLTQIPKPHLSTSLTHTGDLAPVDISLQGLKNGELFDLE